MKRTNYRIVSDTAKVLLIEDLGPWDKYLSVTNGAEHVVQEFYDLGRLTDGKLLEYIDSEGERSLILHNGRGRFIGFAASLD